MTKIKNVFVVIVLILVSIIYYQFYLSIQLQKIVSINNQIKIKSQLLKQNSIEVEELIKNKILVHINNFKLNILNQKVPLTVNMQKNIVDIKNISEKNNIQIKNIKIESENLFLEEEQFTIYEKPINLIVIGKYNDLVLFVNEINSLKSIYSINNLNISVHENQVQAEFYISIYLIEGEY